MKGFHVTVTIATADGGSVSVKLGRLSESSHECSTWAYDYFSAYVILGLKIKPVKGTK